MPETAGKRAFRAVDRIRSRIAGEAVETRDSLISITASFGVAEIDKACLNLDDLLDRAGQAVHVAKRTGKNRVAIWRPDEEQGAA